MNGKLERIYGEAELNRKKTLQMVSKLSFAELNHAPEGKWTISQIVSHLITSEQLSLQYMRKKSLGIAEAGNSGIWEDLKFLFLQASQRIPLKYKAPAILGKLSNDPLSFPEIVRQWEDVRGNVKTFIEGFDDSNIRKKIYKHPAVGPLNVVQAIGFFNEHVNHHLPQIKRLL